MSIRNLTQPNNNKIFAKEFIGELNGIQGQVITGLNEQGQVLTIVSTNPKVVAFQDVPEGIPDTVGFPDGYVLKIIDNTTNEVNWEPDSIGGAVVPFILTGNSFTAFQVRNNAFEQSIIIDSTINTVQLPGTTRVEGVDIVNKFGVYNNADSINPEFAVDTFNHTVKISGPDDTEKFAIYNPTDPVPIFSVNSSEAILTIRADGESIIDLVALDNIISVSDTSGSNVSTIQLKNQNGITDRLSITHTNDGTDISQIKCTNLNMDSKVNVIGSDVKDKFTVSNLAGDKEFKVDTNGGIISCKILGSNSGEKLRVLNFADKIILNVNTVSNELQTQGKILVNGDTDNYKLLVEDNTGNEVFRVDTSTDTIYFGDSNGTNITRIEPNIAKQIIYGSGILAPTLLLKNLTQNSELSLVATADANPNKLISNKPLTIQSTGNASVLATSGDASILGNITTLTANNGNVNLLASDGMITPQFSVRNDASLLLIEDTFLPAANHLEIRFNQIISKGNPLTLQSYINFNPTAGTIQTSSRELYNIMTYVNELPGSGTLPSVPTPTAQVAFSQFVWTGATLITPSSLLFTVVSPGVLRYDGPDTRWFHINVELGLVSASADQVIQMVLLDAADAIIPASLSQFYTSTTDRNGGSSVNISLQLSNLNQIKVAVRTPRATTSLTLENFKLQVIEI